MNPKTCWKLSNRLGSSPKWIFNNCISILSFRYPSLEIKIKINSEPYSTFWRISNRCNRPNQNKLQSISDFRSTDIFTSSQGSLHNAVKYERVNPNCNIFISDSDQYYTKQEDIIFNTVLTFCYFKSIIFQAQWVLCIPEMQNTRAMAFW